MQDGIKDCGVCSLLSIIRYYGGNVSKEYLREITNTTKNGVTAYNLIKGATALGFEANGMEGELEKVEQEDLPCIAHVIINKSYQHFLVIYDIDIRNEKLLIMDPAKGKKIISFKEFKLISSFKYIFLKPTKKLPIFNIKKVIKKMTIKNILESKTILVIIIFLSIIYFVLNIATSFHFKYIIEYAITPQMYENVVLISRVLLWLYLLKEISSLIRNVILLKWSSIFDFDLTSKTFDQIISFPYLYYKNRTTGEVISRIKDLTVVKNFVAKFICFSTTEFLALTIFIILLLNINKDLTIYIITFFFIYTLIILITKTPYKNRLRKYLSKEERLNSYIIESVSAFDVVKGLHLEKRTTDKFKLKYKSFLNSFYKLSLIRFIEDYLKNNLNNILTVTIMLIGASKVINKTLSISELIIYQSILMYANSAFINVISIINDYREYKVSKERIEDLFTINKEVFSMQTYFFNQSLLGTIKYKKLTFSYNSTKLLDNIDITITSGSKVFLCGPSGAGKSTLVKMLLRYIEVPYGSISINNIDINHYHLNTIRNKITYVSQNEYLFTDTIKENILIGRDINSDDLDNIIDKMLLRDLVDKSNLGLLTIIEENGFNMSGGERQRIILARSILKDSDIYIFDEALSQIDIKKEEEILKNIFHILKDKTIIIISHRFNNMNLFDKIIRFENARCYEEKV